MQNSFNARGVFHVDGREYGIFRLSALPAELDAKRLPYCLKILLENLLRHEDGVSVSRGDIEALASWDPKAVPEREIAFTPARVLLQDFTGVPVVVDLAAMRDAMAEIGGDPARINPLRPAELVIDHSVQVDDFGSKGAMRHNTELEVARNGERYSFLRWGQKAFDNFKVVPPGTGIVHQVNLEHLARVVMEDDGSGGIIAFPDTVIGTDSHTTMINGLGVLGWGAGGIEAEAAMLGQPLSMLVPQVVGMKLTGSLAEGATATDLVLTITQILRAKGVVGKFVEFFGDGISHLPLADRATIANMAPEYGATCGIFPVDSETLRYLRLTGRPEENIRLIEAYAREQGIFHEPGAAEAEYSDIVELNLASIEPSIAGPKRPHDLVPLSQAKAACRDVLCGVLFEKQSVTTMGALSQFDSEGGLPSLDCKDMLKQSVGLELNGQPYQLGHGAVVIAAITSCTNTSNPAVMVAAGLLARKAVNLGLSTKPWVKTSLAPGSKVVSDYLKKAKLMPYMEALGFHVVGYGCTTCIGNSGPLPPAVDEAISKGDLMVAAVLSGNRNFEGRIHQAVKMNYLASPPLVVAYAIAGRMDIDLTSEPVANDAAGNPIYLRDIWPSPAEVHAAIEACVDADRFRKSYANVFRGDSHWQAIEAPAGKRFAWDEESTYVKQPPYFIGMGSQPGPVGEIRGARVLALLGDFITTDHISPAGGIAPDSPASLYLKDRGVEPRDFNSYGSRRGNHEIMMRGTFANVRLRNRLAPDTEGGYTRHLPDGETMSIFDAAMRYGEEGLPLVVLAGKEYGSGSSRDWAAKGPKLLGVRAVIVESYERIHRSNLVGMGILPLQFKPGEGIDALRLSGHETFDIEGLDEGRAKQVTVSATPPNGQPIRFQAIVRLDTPQEIAYFQHGGILNYVLRQLAKR
ncbi:MAG: aconitate hydratase AcnA [Mariprofundaceae bacterium]